jgi:hypothetical protein
MLDFEEIFKRYDVPKRIRKISEQNCMRFNIDGICDPMYICNVIAKESSSGDGCSHFTGSTIIINPEYIATRLQRSYSCKITTEQINELIEIIKS